jgi:hypothetical protein
LFTFDNQKIVPVIFATQKTHFSLFLKHLKNSNILIFNSQTAPNLIKIKIK